jgi:predicted GNAT family acetyltransferase
MRAWRPAPAWAATVPGLPDSCRAGPGRQHGPGERPGQGGLLALTTTKRGKPLGERRKNVRDAPASCRTLAVQSQASRRKAEESFLELAYRRRALPARQQYPACLADHAAFLLAARADGELVAAALAYDFGDDCGIYNVGTVERARRRGLATALTAGQVYDARTRGCRTASLQSTEIAERVYAAVGFRDLGRILEYVP